MSEAPERIWIEDEFGDGDDDQWTYGTWDVRNYAGYNFEYVRADIVQALTAELADAEAMIEAQAKDHASNNIRFAEAEHRATTAEAERDRLREALGAFVAHYPKGINPDLDAACFAAHAALKGEVL